VLARYKVGGTIADHVSCLMQTETRSMETAGGTRPFLFSEREKELEKRPGTSPLIGFPDGLGV